VKYLTSICYFCAYCRPCLFQRYEIVNGVVEVDSVSDEPTNENAAEGKGSDGIK
jgi:hypothetical protein